MQLSNWTTAILIFLLLVAGCSKTNPDITPTPSQTISKLSDANNLATLIVSCASGSGNAFNFDVYLNETKIGSIENDKPLVSSFINSEKKR